MSMTPAQLTQLLETLPDPARICDESGTAIAANCAAEKVDWDALESDLPKTRSVYRQRAVAGDEKGTFRKTELGAGWRLERVESFQRGLGSGQDHAGYRRKADLDGVLSGLAHELRNPLSAVLTAANLVQSLPGMDEETVMLLDVVRKESVRMNRILIEFSSYIKTHPPHPTAVDVVELVRGIVEELRRDGVLPAGIELDDKLPDECLVEADEAQLGNALGRVVHNAAEAIAGGGSLTLSGRESEGSFVLCITDSGPGFSPESLRRAFEPFYSGKPQAIGLGLSVALQLIEANGGGIWIEGAEGGGARVCIRLPLPQVDSHD